MQEIWSISNERDFRKNTFIAGAILAFCFAVAGGASGNIRGALVMVAVVPVAVWLLSFPAKGLIILYRSFLNNEEHREWCECNESEHFPPRPADITRRKIREHPDIKSRAVDESTFVRRHYIRLTTDKIRQHPACNHNKHIAAATNALVSAAEKLHACSVNNLGDFGWLSDIHCYVPIPDDSDESETRNWIYLANFLLERLSSEYSHLHHQTRDTDISPRFANEMNEVKNLLKDAANALSSRSLRNLSINAFKYAKPVDLRKNASAAIDIVANGRLAYA